MNWNIPKPYARPYPKSPAIADDPSAPAAAPSETNKDGPRCKRCGDGTGAILHGKYGYYFKCAGCAGNTKIRFDCQPGHNPRLRKAGNEFFRDCSECGTSQRYFVNIAASP